MDDRDEYVGSADADARSRGLGLHPLAGGVVYEDGDLLRVATVTHEEEAIRFLLDGLGSPDIKTLHDALEALDELAACMEESDPYPTSDGHPLYKARGVLVALGRREAPAD